MATPKEILKKALVSKEAKAEGESYKEEYREKKTGDTDDTGCICDLVCKVFTTRNLLHFAHWNTKSYAAHNALGELYDAIVDEVDDIVEVYQGENGLVSGFYTEAATIPPDILGHIRKEAAWIKANREGISNGSTTVDNLIDGLLAKYQKAIYKLTNLS